MVLRIENLDPTIQRGDFVIFYLRRMVKLFASKRMFKSTTTMKPQFITLTVILYVPVSFNAVHPQTS